MLTVGPFAGRRRAYSDAGIYEEKVEDASLQPQGESSLLPNCRNSRRGSIRSVTSKSRTPSPGSSKDGSEPILGKATSHLAARAFNLVVTVPHSMRSKSGATLSDVIVMDSDKLEEASLLTVSKSGGTVKSAPGTPHTPHSLPRHDTFVAPTLQPPSPLKPEQTESPISVASSARSAKAKSSTFSKNNRHALKKLSRSTPAMSPSVSPRHSDNESIPAYTKGTKTFLRHFTDAPSSERVLYYYSCALVSDILLQGTLYITPNFFAFYSKIFGYISRLLIPISDVIKIQKEKMVKIIPNAIGITTSEEKTYIFGSLLSRDTTYKNMVALWNSVQDNDGIIQPLETEATIEDEAVDSVSGSCSADSINDLPDASSSQAVLLDAPPFPLPLSEGSSLTKSDITPLFVELPVVSRRNSDRGPPTPRDKLPQGDAYTGKPSKPEKDPISFGATSEGLQRLLPRTSFLLTVSTALLVLLFLSAAFMLHRVDSLSQQLGGLHRLGEYEDLYEEVLQMQQRLHSAATTEVEKTLSIQIKQIATVRQSLEALVQLFSQDSSAKQPLQFSDQS